MKELAQKAKHQTNFFRLGAEIVFPLAFGEFSVSTRRQCGRIHLV